MNLFFRILIFAVNSIKSRIVGRRYQQLQGFLHLKKLPDWPFLEDKLKCELAKYAKSSVGAYFFTSYLQGNSFHSLYQCLCELYTSKQSESLFDFNGVIIPKASSCEQKRCLIDEYIDFLSYYTLDDHYFCDCITAEGPYELGNVQVDSGDVVIDCGANMGIFSAIAGQKGATVYAFEPFEYVIKNFLSKTAEHNPNIHICKYALSSEEKDMYFTSNAKKLTGNKLTKINKSNCVTVQTTTLDAFAEKNHLSKIDFIKADIEGAERSMLIGARRVLKEFAPKLAICNYHLPDDPIVLRKLILDANPNYVIENRFLKMYAYVPR